MILIFLGMNKKQQKVSAKDEPASGSKSSNTSQVHQPSLEDLWFYAWELDSWKGGNTPFVKANTFILLNKINNFTDHKHQIQPQLL